MAEERGSREMEGVVILLLGLTDRVLFALSWLMIAPFRCSLDFNGFIAFPPGWNS